MSPVDFVPVAEEFGLIVDIGQWMLAGIPRRLGVQLSIENFGFRSHFALAKTIVELAQIFGMRGDRERTARRARPPSTGRSTRRRCWIGSGRPECAERHPNAYLMPV
ncbi:hypothetical protein HH310_13560 [Actinoplanes sp. TBRC 11911]|uniref:hypothetical protein n=1 Tax=Actinoplanes sp. TBRC 11911 TaxID=2729386 RepID=UPI00145E150F|nr:hypothetical protein [Actinoplanes sp. TBRC 11911]NMO52220.1 hypothetical protein [Actinoplanes sp. TBRC 11911]